MSDFSWNKAIQKMTDDESEKRIQRKQNQASVEEVKAYSVTIFECECPHCEEVNRLADDDCVSGASFEHECISCHNKFPVRCE